MPAPIGNTNNPAWPRAHVEALVRYLARGKSHSQIAVALNEDFPGSNYTRNSTIGKCNRLGLSNSKTPEWLANNRERNSKAQKRRSQREVAAGTWMGGCRPQSLSAATPRPPAPILHCAEVIPMNVRLLDLDRNGCRWPCGQGVSTTFCNHPQQFGSAYCPHHRALSIGAGTPSEKRAHHVTDKALT